MSWGALVNGINGRLPIDDDFDNLVYRGSGARRVGEGIHDIQIEPRGVPSLVVAARHPGLDVALLSYLSDGQGTTGVRVYVRGAGTLYWRTYQPATPISGGWGVEIRNAGGQQVFHSDHRYADVRDSRSELGGTGYLAGGHYYVFNAPAVPAFEYTTQVTATTQADRRYQQTGTRKVRRTRREYQCWYEYQYVPGSGYQRVRTCDWVTVEYFEDQPIRDWVIVGWWTYTTRAVLCRKTLAMTHHSTTDYLSRYSHRLSDWAVCFEETLSQYTRSSQPFGPQQFPPDYMSALGRVTNGTVASGRIEGHNNRLILVE
ncbi:hypothetical protein [Salinicola sp. DM10]|uniref:hypothetical protein n=1 Tax=Salinicola sp. DM10 TaxID=2815721 RepID=UPI001A8F6039|nr:hypothetical protein [Salinicola sp. DM10]MCE3025720.1 hypothetical protein [Salinicola sp. DM10]